MTDLGDRLRRGGAVEPGIPLHGDAYGRIMRGIQALLGQDPNQIQVPGQILLDTDKIAVEMTLLNLDAAPFRKIGRGIAPGLSIAASAAHVGVFELVNLSKAGLIVLDTLIHNGLSTLVANVSATAGNPLAATNAAGVVDIESPPPASPASQVTRPLVHDLTQSINNTGVAPVTAGSVVGQFPAAGGPFPFPLVLWPGETLDISQLTVNLAYFCQLYGRFFDFGAQLPQQQ